MHCVSSLEFESRMYYFFFKPFLLVLNLRLYVFVSYLILILLWIVLAMVVVSLCYGIKKINFSILSFSNNHMDLNIDDLMVFGI